MATGIGPKKSLFKRRAGPVIVQRISPDLNANNPTHPATSTSTTHTPPPASLTSAASSGLTIDGGTITTDESDSSPPRPPSAPSQVANHAGIDLFRRAKHFYPKAIEASLRAGAKQNNAVPSQPKSNGHDTKRRKVSSEQDGDAADRVLTILSRSPSPAGEDDAASPVLSHDTSASPTPQRRLDKGKGIATVHTVNAGIVFTDAPSAATKQTSPGVVGAEAEAETEAEADTSTNTRAKAEGDVVVLLDDDSDGNSEIKPPKPRPRKDSWEEEDDDEHAKKCRLRNVDQIIVDDDSGDGGADAVTDPEFEEYIITARARNAASRAAQEVKDINAQLAANAHARQSTGSGHPADTEDRRDRSFDSQATMASSSSTAAASAAASFGADRGLAAEPLNDQSYRIFITPRLPQPVPPLIANVRMDQEMRHVKHAFLSHARDKGCELPADIAKSVLLTWKGAKIYDFTTGLTLKLQPDAKGRFHEADGLGGLSSLAGGGDSSGGSHKVSAGFVSGGLHIEIWTDELYEKYVLDQEKRRRRDMGEALEEDLMSDDDGDDDDDEAAQLKREESTGSRLPSQQQTQDKIRLVLASRSYDKLSVTAHSDTTIDTLIHAFRIQRAIDADRTVTIWMDGEQLEGSTTVGDADMEDMDSVEVHIS